MEKSEPHSPAVGLRILFAGSGDFGLPTLQALAAAGHRIVLVVSQIDRWAGRGRTLTPTPVAQFALQRSWPLLRTPDLNRESLPEADLLLVIAFGQKIGLELAARPRLGSANLHASRLPMYRGAAPINWAILRGEQATGNSVIRLAQRMDAGAILGQSLLAIGELETAGELHDRLARDGADLVLRVLDQLAAGTAQEAQQIESFATHAPKLMRESAQLDWTQSAAELACRIRGLYPWPGCRVQLLDETGAEHSHLTLVRARPVAATTAAAAPGSLDAAGHISTANGSLEILELQPDGKRPMPLAAYAHGHPWRPGLRIISL